MHGVIATILKFRFLVVVLAAVLMVFGVIQLRRMPADVLPEFSPPYVEIQTEALGLSTEEVEQLITVPLEHNLLNGVAWLEKIRSESVAGLSSVTLIFQPGTDLYRARQMVAERLAQGAPTLPRVSRGPVMLQPKSATSRVMIVRLSSKKLSAIQMSVLARWTITPRLMGVPGVANVAVWGMRDRQLQVQVDPDRLRAYQVPLLRLLESVGNALWVSTLSYVEAATPGNAGFIDTPQQRLGIQHISPIVSAESLAQVTVQRADALLMFEPQKELARVPKFGEAVRLMDVADVVENHQPLIGDALAGDGANLLLVIDKFPGSDTVAVTRGVEDALATMSPGLSGMEIDSIVFRPATFIETARQNLARAALLAGAIVLVLLGLFFRDWRATLVSFISILLSLILAGLVLYLRGATLNIMILVGMAVALGVVVGDAVLVVETILRRPRQRETPLAGAILETMLEMRGGMLFAALICVLAVLPVFALPGIAGNFFRPLVVSYVLAVVASTFVALIVAPALAAILLRNVPARTPNRGLQMPAWKPRTAYLAIAVLALVGVGSIPFLRPSLLPTFKERDLLIRLETMPGTSHPEMVRLVNRVTAELRAIPDIHKVGALVGRAVFGDRVVGINSAELLVNIASTADYDATVAAIQSVVNGYPGLKSNVQTYLNQIAAEEISAPIVVRLYGQDWTALRSKAEELRQNFSQISGVSDLKIDLPVEEPTLDVEVDITAAQRYGISPGNVRRAASALLNGIQVGSLFQEQKVFDVVVWSTPKTRSDLTNVHNLLIDTPFDLPVRLGDVAQARLVSRPSLIRHENVSRYIDIDLNVSGRKAGSVKAEIQSRLRQFQFPLEYHAKIFDAHEEERSKNIRLLAYSSIALIALLLFLHAAFDSWRLAFLSLLTVPLALVGGLVALAVLNASWAAVFGLLTVFGVTTRNQIELIRDLRITRVRFRPILMTAVTIGLALVPLLFMGDAPGLELMRPMAIVIMCGLVTSTLVNLFALPALYRSWMNTQSTAPDNTQLR